MDAHKCHYARGGSRSYRDPITALLLVYNGFKSLERRLEVLEGDYKNFYREQSNHANDIHNLQQGGVSKLNEKMGL